MQIWIQWEFFAAIEQNWLNPMILQTLKNTKLIYTTEFGILAVVC